MADESCADIKLDVADWLLTKTSLKKLPPDAAQLLKDCFPAPPPGTVSGKLCLSATTQSHSCKKSERAEPGRCCKFDHTPLLSVVNMPDEIKFATPGAAGVAAVSVEVTLKGDNKRVHVEHLCEPHACQNEKARADAWLRVEGKFTLAGVSFEVKGTKDLEKDIFLTCKSIP